MNIKKLSSLLAASLFCIACSSEDKVIAPSKAERPKKASPEAGDAAPVGYQTKQAPYEKKDNHTSPKPILPDIGPADLLEWQIKATPEAMAKLEGCKGYQALQAKNPENISITTHKDISPSMPFWVFAIQEKTSEQTTILNYCTLTATTLAIDCDPVGAAICP